MTEYGLPPVLGLLDGDPRTLGPYRIAGRLGQGGMGTVYLAEGIAGPVALKVISPHRPPRPQARQRAAVPLWGRE
ncbi:hypothetical protein [Nonomuraea insulae]|uniref:Protein kinase domain-containing protein n=1 Tax=Nonomuraea insulae TaxID=1616787 RepID=A0ABW1CR83_9ACTN